MPRAILWSSAVMSALPGERTNSCRSLKIKSAFQEAKTWPKKKKRTQSCMNDKQIQFTFRHVALSHRGEHATFLFYDSKYNGVFATSQKVWSPSCMSLFPWSFKQVRPIPWISSFSDDEKQSRCKGYTFLKFK